MASFTAELVATPGTTNQEFQQAAPGDIAADTNSVGTTSVKIGTNTFPVTFRRFDQGLETPG